MIPGMQSEPRSTHWPDAITHAVDRNGVSPDVGVVVDDEAVRTVIRLRDLATFRPRGVDQIKEWVDELGHVEHVHGPVVHLRIDVDGVLRAPRRVHAFVPFPL